MMCQQCDEASCAKVCPTAALSRAKGANVVTYEKAKCIGCRMCTIACPFGCASYDAPTASILKCDNCGGEPACAKACPTHAISFVDDSIATRSRKKSFAARFKTAFEEA
jgi:Fe-S-cluster-containing hydrogenase component 2